MIRRPFSLTNALSSLLLSVGLALIIWVAAANNDLERIFNYPNRPEQRGIPVELRNVPPGLIVVEGAETRVWVDLLIHRERSRELTPDDILAYADLSELAPGRHQVEVVVERQPFAPNFRLLDTNPDRITIALDEQLTREFPVELEISDLQTIAQNYQVLTPTIEPPTITVRGPAALMEPVDRVVAEVEVEGARQTVVRTVTPLLLSGDEVVAADDLRFSSSRVEVTIPVEQKPGYRELIVRTEITGTAELGERGYWISRFTPDPDLVAVVGQQAVVDGLNGIVQTEAVNVSELEEGTIIRQVPLQLPDGISPVEEDFVTVTIQVEPQTSSKTVSLIPRVAGLEPGLEVAESGIVPSTIDVLLRGPIRELVELNLDEINATLDMADREAGTYLVQPRISTPSDLRAESIIPEQVEVTIVEQRESRDLSIPVRALRLPDGVAPLFEPRFVTVTLEGPLLDVEALDMSRLQASVDTNELDAGPHVLTPTVSVGRTISVTAITPPQVNLELVSQQDVRVVTAPVRVVGVAPGQSARLNSDVVIVRVVGPEDGARLVENPNFAVTMDLAGQEPGSYLLRPDVRLPAGYQVVAVVPERIEVRISEE